MKLSVEIRFEPRDLWLGAFFDTAKDTLYVCLVPCFPVILIPDRAEQVKE